MKLYAKKADDAWYKGTLVDIVNLHRSLSEVVYLTFWHVAGGVTCLGCLFVCVHTYVHARTKYSLTSLPSTSSFFFAFWLFAFWHYPCSMQCLQPRVYVTVKHPSVFLSVHLSVLSFDCSSCIWWGCCWAPCRHEISTGSVYVTAGHPAAMALRHGSQHGTQQQMWAVLCWQPSWRGWAQTY